MSKCNEIIHAAYQALNENKPIDDIIPYNLDCFTAAEREEIYYIGAVHFTDPKRRDTCRKKLKLC